MKQVECSHCIFHVGRRVSLRHWCQNHLGRCHSFRPLCPQLELRYTRTLSFLQQNDRVLTTREKRFVRRSRNWLTLSNTRTFPTVMRLFINRWVGKTLAVAKVVQPVGGHQVVPEAKLPQKILRLLFHVSVV